MTREKCKKRERKVNMHTLVGLHSLVSGKHSLACSYNDGLPDPTTEKSYMILHDSEVTG